MSDPTVEPEARSGADRREPSPRVPATLERIGEYRILGVLGEGGMGVVYLAEQEKPRRVVALKVIRAGASSPSMRRRFELETQLLGRLQHPGIAQIFDAGVADTGHGSQPYFAMEYIRGKPLLEHAAAHRLGTRERLRLFVEVAQAVHYAHQNGVIHRDLKPGNVLVDEHGHPRILDFGVARSSAESDSSTTIRTDLGQLIGTVPYMSPEQLGGDTSLIDTRSDVYALGVLMYELISGRLPHDVRQKPIPEAIRIIGQQDHTPLSSINRVFRGDLDTIVTKALEKDRRRRYQTAAELALDVQRYLQDEPIVARRASTLYQLQKLAKRNRALVAALALVLLALVAGTVVSTMYALRAAAALSDAVAARSEEALLRIVAEDRRQEAEGLARDALRQAYLANIAAADSALSASDMSTARRRLLMVSENLRGNWEWRYLFHRLDDTYTFLGLGGSALYAMKHASAEGSLVVGCWDRSVRVLPPGEFTPRLVLSGHTGRIFAVDVTADGRVAVASGDGGSIRAWDLQRGTVISEWQASEQAIHDLAISSDGSTVVSAAEDGRVRLWQLTSGGPLREWTGHEASAVAVAFTGPSSTDAAAEIVSASADGTLRWWSRAEDAALRVVDAHTGSLRDMELSTDAALIATAGDDGVVAIWDAATGSLRSRLRGHVGAARAVAFSPSGDLVASGGKDATLRLWDARTGEARGVLRGHSQPVYDVQFDPRGEFITSTAADGNLRLWDPAVVDGIGELRGHSAAVGGAAFSWDGQRIISSAWDRTLRAWDVSTGREVLQVPGSTETRALAVSPDGLHLAADDGPSIVLRDASTLAEFARIHAHQDVITRLRFSDDGALVLSCSHDGTVALSNVRERSVIGRLSREGDSAVAATFVGSQIAVIWRSSVLTLQETWDQPVRWEAPLPAQAGREVVGSRDGSLVVVGTAEGEILTIDGASGESTGAYMRCPSAVIRMAISPDGRRLAAGTYDGTIRLWDTASGDEVLALRGHQLTITALQWSPDGERLVSASQEPTIRIWEPVRVGDRLKARREAGRR